MADAALAAPAPAPPVAKPPGGGMSEETKRKLREGKERKKRERAAAAGMAPPPVAAAPAAAPAAQAPAPTRTPKARTARKQPTRKGSNVARKSNPKKKPGVFARVRQRVAKAVAPKGTRVTRSRARRGAGPAAPSVLVAQAAPMVAAPRRRRSSGKKEGAIAKHTPKATEMLVDGLLIVGGTAAAIQLDKMVTVRPLGLNPSVYALGITIAVAVGARKYKKPKVSRGAASLAVGLAAGMVGKALMGGGGPVV